MGNLTKEEESLPAKGYKFGKLGRQKAAYTKEEGLPVEKCNN